MCTIHTRKRLHLAMRAWHRHVTRKLYEREAVHLMLRAREHHTLQSAVRFWGLWAACRREQAAPAQLAAAYFVHRSSAKALRQWRAWLASRQLRQAASVRIVRMRSVCLQATVLRLWSAWVASRREKCASWHFAAHHHNASVRAASLRMWRGAVAETRSEACAEQYQRLRYLRAAFGGLRRHADLFARLHAATLQRQWRCVGGALVSWAHVVRCLADARQLAAQRCEAMSLQLQARATLTAWQARQLVAGDVQQLAIQVCTPCTPSKHTLESLVSTIASLRHVNKEHFKKLNQSI